MGKTLKIGLFIAFIALSLIVGSSLSMAYLCYQETTNKSTASNGICSLNYTGGYYDAYLSLEVYDENWSSYYYVSPGCQDFYVNYTIPNNAISAIYTAKYGDGVTTYFINYSVPSTCFRNDKKLNFKFHYGSDCGGENDFLFCYNSTNSFQTMGDLVSSGIYEEGVYWNITPILGLCNSTLNILAINFTSYDETNFTRISPFSFEGVFDYNRYGDYHNNNFSWTNISTKEIDICLSPPDINYSISGTIQYSDSSSVYTPRTYYFLNDIINNITTNLSLYLIPNSDSTTFIQKVLDRNQIPMQDVYIYTQRYYPGTASYKTVQVTKTGADGKTIGFYKTETVFYRHILKDNLGSILLDQPSQKIYPETAPYTLTFTVGEGYNYPGTPSSLDGFSYSLNASELSKYITYTYSDSSGYLINSSMTVEKVVLSGSNVLVCNSSSTQSAATLTCNISAYDSGSFKIRLIASRTDNLYKIIESLTFKLSDNKLIFGRYGLFLAWFIILVAAMAFVYNPIAGILSIDIAVIFVNIIGLASFSYTGIFSVIALSVIAIIAIRNSSGGYP